MREPRLNDMPLGAAALAGTSFPIDRDMTATALEFDRPMANSLDAVSDRDFVMETLAAASIASVHLSRFAEEIVIWTSPLTGLIKLSDKFTTGSSIMPQKRNPDAAELVRAKTGRIVGALNAMLMVMKGLPLAYQKDMQEDKEGTIDALDALALSIEAMTGMVRDMEPDAERMKAAAGAGYATATDLADWLVRTLKMPFREAHHVTGRIVAKAAASRPAAARAAARRDEEDRAENHASRVRRALGGSLGRKPHELRRHRAGQRARAGQEMAEDAGTRAELNVSMRARSGRASQMTHNLLWCAQISEPALSRPYSPIVCPRRDRRAGLGVARWRAAAAKVRSTRRPAAMGSSRGGRTPISRRGAAPPAPEKQEYDADGRPIAPKDGRNRSSSIR